MLKASTLIIFCLFLFSFPATAQKSATAPKTAASAPQNLKKTNRRADAKPSDPAAEPFDKADVATMAKQCVKFETEAGAIELELFPESAPESVRNFLNLVTTGAFDTTVFSRVVPGFIIQGGDLTTRLKPLTPELDKRMRRTVIDEPSPIKHERGIISMARADTPNSATTNFFILMSEARHLDGTFAAFGRVTRGMDVAENINKMPVQNEKPEKPVRVIKASAAVCPAPLAP